MIKLLFLVAACCCFNSAQASFVTDETFISYEQFDRLSKKEINQKFGTNTESRKIIESYYRSRSKGVLWLIPALILNTGGVYFSILSSNATNGMASTVGLVLAIALFIPGIISLYLFGKRFLFRKRASKKILYERLKAYYKK